MDRNGHRIWLELERPDSKKGEDHTVADERARLANNMLNALANPLDGPSNEFWWSQRDSRYCYGNASGFVTLADGGQWLNLSYLGRDDREAKYTGAYI